MKFIYFSVFLFSIVNLSCADSARRPAGNSDEGTGKKSKPPSSFSDTLIIDFPSAVFYYPDSVQLEKIKGTTTKDAFASDEHNCFYQMRNARSVVKKYWPRIRVIETSSSRFLLFIKNGNGQALVDLNSKGDMCGLFLFDGKKNPELADMMNIDTVLEFYFSTN